MKIVYVVTRADELGGAQIHVRDLAIALRAAGHEATVLAGAPGALSDQLTCHGVPFRAVPDLVRPIAPRRDVAALRGLIRALKELRPDLVTTHSAKAGWLGRLAARRLGLPVLFTAHAWAFTEGVPRAPRRFYTLAERLAAPLADHILTVSDYDRALALAHRIAPPERITRIHNGVHDRPRPPPRPPGGPLQLVMIGRFTPQKDHALLLHALARLREQDWRLTLIGGGPGLPAATALARELAIAERVRFLGERGDARDFLGQADLYALISNWEGLPRSILEAMSAGLPVVASAIGGVPETVTDQVSGLLVPRGDHEALVAALARLIAEPALRRRLGQASRRRYEAEFRFELMLERTVAIYHQVLAGRARARA